MPIATPAQYAAMLDAAQEGGYGYPAVNVTSLVTLNAGLKGFAEKRSDGIIQLSLGGSKFASGLGVGDNVLGAIVIAEAAHRLADRYDVLIALHTDHCQPGYRDSFLRQWLAEEAQKHGCELDEEGRFPAHLIEAHPQRYGWIADLKPDANVDTFLKPLIAETARRRAAGQGNLFQSHMLDASNLPLELNMRLSREILAECAANEIVLEVEAGVVGGEEEGAGTTSDKEKRYTSPDDMQYVYEQLHDVGRFLFAATFGNVHGHYKPEDVHLRPEILKQGQQRVVSQYGPEAELDLVFHGGSGSPVDVIRETLDYGVVKMNIDTDTQYAFTRPIVEHVLSNAEAIVDRANKKLYDPRSYLKKAEASMSERLAEACDHLRSSGRTLCGKL